MDLFSESSEMDGEEYQELIEIQSALIEVNTLKSEVSIKHGHHQATKSNDKSFRCLQCDK